jgi:hypothetical protein
MTFTGINYIAVIIAALAGFGLGAIWYRVFAKPWMHAVGKTETDRPQGSAQVALFTLAFVALLIMAWMLAGLMGHLGQVSIRGGVITSFFVWLGFVITTMGVNYAFAGAKRILTLIDGGYWLAVLSIQGAIIGAFGV